MPPKRDRGQGRVAAVVVLTLDEASRIYQIAPAMLIGLERRLAMQPKRQVSSGSIGYYSSDIEDALAAEQAHQRAAEGDRS